MRQPRRPRLEGKVAIVTGAGSQGPGFGTGKAISTLFATKGARVLLVNRVASHAEEPTALIREEGGEASAFAADVTRAKDCEAMVSAAVERYGGLHILVNNVGIHGPGDAMTVDEEEWDRVLTVNLKSMMLTSKYAIPRMIEAGGGSIINVSSGGALRGTLGFSTLPYSVSKGGVNSLTISMAAAHGRDNVRVNCISPRSVLSPMVADEIATEEQLERRRLITALGKTGTAWDVAWAAVFLASDEARWITGVNLLVDGGSFSMHPGPPAPQA